jgi:TolA-binding protein
MNRLLLILPLMLLFASCRTSADIQREKDMGELRQELSRVQSNNADTGQNLDSVKEDIQKLKGDLEKLQHGSNADRENYLKKISDLEAKLDAKFDKITKDLADNIESMKKDFQDAVKKIDDVAMTGKKESKKEAVQDKMNLDARYKKARKLHKSKNYTEAESLYATVAGSKSKWYDERAKFYLGSILFDQDKYKEAVIKIQEFLDAYPDSGFAPAGLFIQAQCFIKLKKTKDAKVFFQDLISKFPKSKEAGQAKEKLKKL